MRIRAFEITAQYVVIFYFCKFRNSSFIKTFTFYSFILKQGLQLVRSLTIAKQKRLFKLIYMPIVTVKHVTSTNIQIRLCLY